MLKDFAAHHKLTHQLMAITKDNWDKAGQDYGFRGIPTVAVVDRQGHHPHGARRLQPR